jgi:dTDP-glucose 4,6-dehydratase
MSQALRGQPLTVFGDGSQTRSFCYVDDLIEGIWRLLHSDEVMPTNIGNPSEMTILQFAELVRELTGSTSEIAYRELPVDDPKVRQPDIAKAQRILGWQPRVSLRDGLTRTLAYFRERLEIGGVEGLTARDGASARPKSRKEG